MFGVLSSGWPYAPTTFVACVSVRIKMKLGRESAMFLPPDAVVGRTLPQPGGAVNRAQGLQYRMGCFLCCAALRHAPVAGIRGFGDGKKIRKLSPNPQIPAPSKVAYRKCP